MSAIKSARTSLLSSRSAGEALNISTFAAYLNSLTLCSTHPRSSIPRISHPISCIFSRNASHAAQGRANGPKDSAGRRLGAKKSDSEYVIPGNIIFKQRGTKWFPGENTTMGRDHTIHANVAGYVRYYRDPHQHPKRKYIGVALEREGPRSKLPTPRNAPTRRRLGMYATPTPVPTSESLQPSSAPPLSNNPEGDGGDDRPFAPISTPDMTSLAPLPTTPASPHLASGKQRVALTMLQDAQAGRFRPTNYAIGQTPGVKVRAYDRKDRWLAWRKRTARVKKGALLRAGRKVRKPKGKKVNKGTTGGAGRKR